MQFHDLGNAKSKVAELSAFPGVKAVFNVGMIDIPDEVVWRGTPGKNYRNPVKKRDDDYGDYDVDANSPHVMTQVDKLRAQGLTGKGIKVAVVDTGIDYTHPALGGCFGKGCLVSYGKDLVGNNYPAEKEPSDDPMDCYGHGTHVAGIIAAQSNPFGFTGAAPGVELGAYKVFACSGGVADEEIIDGFYAAYEDGSDIINASLGGSVGWSSSLLSEAINRLTAKGVICVVAAGNEGDEGIFFAADPGAAESVSTIASFQNIKTPELLTEGTYSIDDSPFSGFGFRAGSPAAWDDFSMVVYATSNDTEVPDDACDPLPSDTPDLSKYITLIRRGTCDFPTKIQNAVDHGAEYVLIYNNVPGVADVDGSDTDVKAVAMIEAEEGELWVKAIKGGSTLMLTMADPETADDFLIHANNTFDGGFPVTSSTWGPTWELNIKPNFGAPGGNILSTYPVDQGSFAVLGGTSMAAPLAAGAMALIAEARGSLDPVEMRNILAATSTQSRFHDGSSANGLLAPVPQQGAGLIQAYDAAYTNTLLDVSSINFNDTDHFEGEQKFTIKNIGNKAIEYTFDHRPAATVYTYYPSSRQPMAFPNDLAQEYATIKLSPSKFTVEPGKTKTLTVTAVQPKGLKTDRLPVYSGFINLHGSDDSISTVPYMGVAASMYDQPILGESTEAYFEIGDNLGVNHTITLPYPGTASSSLDDLPQVHIDLNLGSALIWIDAVPVDIKDADDFIMEHLGDWTVGDIINSPHTYSSRGSASASWDGRLGDGRYAPEGTYKIAIRALRPFGDPEEADDYDSYHSKTFRIKYGPKPERQDID